jgi:hypothetical protein
VIGLAGGQQLARHLGVPLGAGELVDRLAVPAEAEPGQAVEDRRRSPRLVERWRSVSSMRSSIVPPVLPGVEPVEQRRAPAADVQEARRGGRKAGDDGHDSSEDDRGSRAALGSAPESAWL